MAEEINLPCDQAPTKDGLKAERSAGLVEIHVTEVGTRSKDVSMIFLNETSARQLFNWLGVQLHKGGWDG